MMKERITFLDAAKALAIALVILGHCDAASIPYLPRIIWSFHMPLFFLISGMFLRSRPTGEALRKYARAYLVPYFLVSLFGIGMEAFIRPGLVEDCILAMVWGSHDIPAHYFGLGHRISCGPQWFLFALFSGCMIFNFVSRISDTFRRWLTTVVIAVLGIVIGRLHPLPFSICHGAFASLYLMVGSEIRRLDLIEEFCALPKMMMGLCVVAWLALVGFHDGVFDMGSMLSGGFSTIVISVVASLVVLSVVRKIPWDGGWMGRSTLAILCGHSLILSHLIPMCGRGALDFTSIRIVNFLIALVINFAGALLLALILQHLPVIGRFFCAAKKPK